MNAQNVSLSTTTQAEERVFLSLVQTKLEVHAQSGSSGTSVLTEETCLSRSDSTQCPLMLYLHHVIHIFKSAVYKLKCSPAFPAVNVNKIARHAGG